MKWLRNLTLNVELLLADTNIETAAVELCELAERLVLQ